jgi:hypothetical protein
MVGNKVRLSARGYQRQSVYLSSKLSQYLHGRRMTMGIDEPCVMFHIAFLVGAYQDELAGNPSWSPKLQWGPRLV